MAEATPGILKISGIEGISASDCAESPKQMELTFSVLITGVFGDVPLPSVRPPALYMNLAAAILDENGYAEGAALNPGVAGGRDFWIRRRFIEMLAAAKPSDPVMLARIVARTACDVRRSSGTMLQQIQTNLDEMGNPIVLTYTDTEGLYNANDEVGKVITVYPERTADVYASVKRFQRSEGVDPATWSAGFIGKTLAGGWRCDPSAAAGTWKCISIQGESNGGDWTVSYEFATRHGGWAQYVPTRFNGEIPADIGAAVNEPASTYIEPTQVEGNALNLDSDDPVAPP